MAYLYDTNIIIYYLQQQFPVATEIFIDSLIQKQSPVISVITEIELLCWNGSLENDIEVLKSFIGETIVIPLEQDVKLRTIEIRKKYKLKMPDAIIAASALVHDLTLLTRNLNDFKLIPELKIINPWEPPTI